MCRPDTNISTCRLLQPCDLGEDAGRDLLTGTRRHVRRVGHDERSHPHDEAVLATTHNEGKDPTGDAGQQRDEATQTLLRILVSRSCTRRVFGRGQTAVSPKSSGSLSGGSRTTHSASSWRLDDSFAAQDLLSRSTCSVFIHGQGIL